MKPRILLTAILVTIMSINISAQANNFSFGLVGTRFDNFDNDNKLTEIDNPMGYGLIVGYKINNDLTVAFTGEYFEDDLSDNLGTETDYRGHLSAFLTPFRMEKLRPYLSAGFVFTHRNIEYNQTGIDSDKNMIHAKFGVGFDYRLIQNIGLNFDLGVYSDGLNMDGWSSSFGLRYML